MPLLFPNPLRTLAHPDARKPWTDPWNWAEGQQRPGAVIRRRSRQGSSIRNGFANVRTIGTGERSAVLLGADPLDNSPVVIKELDVSMLSTAAVQAWLGQSAGLVAASQHPNIVTLYAVVHQQRDTIVALEQYCPGSSDLLAGSDKLLIVEQVIAIGMRIAEALSWLHAQGVLHLDITTKHIRFADESTPCLADVGIGSLYPHRWRLSQGRVADGAWHTPPELIRDQAPSPASDVYSLASVLFELLSGTPPIPPLPGESPGGLCRRILNDPIRPIVAAGVPRQLSDLLTNALAKEPMQRPSTAEMFAEQLWDAAGALGKAWTGALAIPRPDGVLRAHDTVVIWSPESG